MLSKLVIFYFQAEDTVLPVAWRIINDSLRTDVSLLFPPHQVSLLLLIFDLATRKSSAFYKVAWCKAELFLLLEG